MTYIPPERRDTRYALWYIRYRVRIPNIQMYTAEELIENGLPTSGDPNHDHAMQWEPRHMALPIHRIAELWGEGANVSLLRASDALPIYQAVEAHLQAWKKKIEERFNPGEVPEADLLLLDRFASMIYVHAKPLFSNEFIAANFVIAGRRHGSRRNVVAAVSKREEERMAHEEKNKDNLIFSNLRVHKPTLGYSVEKERQRTQIDYSGQELIADAPPRASLASFMRRD